MRIRPIGFCSRFFTALLSPLMRLISGAPFEAPQSTHFWNNQKLAQENIGKIHQSMRLSFQGNLGEEKSWLAFVPILGGWKNFVVLRPRKFYNQEWLVGWIAENNVFGISLVRIKGDVRLRLGPGDVQFFAIDADGCLIELKEVGRGEIGDNGPYCQTLLL